ncbi:MAG: adenylyltransferase/cytidyltransferase family protein [Alkalibacterium sp.]|nr:adenylyltransferase/cytidyltransferase family protein [Alkalibacterium sp.]
MKRALYAGSFDPLTYGHLDILNRAAGLVDELIVIVSASTAKRYLFSTEERLENGGNQFKGDRR